MPCLLEGGTLLWKYAIAYYPHKILTNVLLVSHILLLFHSLKSLQNKLQNKRNSRNICNIARSTMQQLFSMQHCYVIIFLIQNRLRLIKDV